jgi:DNA-binding IclR family transcriptional regulator
LELELDRAKAAGISWPDLEPNLESTSALVAKVRRERVACVDGRYIPGLNAISSAITNWQAEVEVAVTLFGTHPELLEAGSPARRSLIEFASRHSIGQTERIREHRGALVS